MIKRWVAFIIELANNSSNDVSKILCNYNLMYWCRNVEIEYQPNEIKIDFQTYE